METSYKLAEKLVIACDSLCREVVDIFFVCEQSDVTKLRNIKAAVICVPDSFARDYDTKNAVILHCGESRSLSTPIYPYSVYVEWFPLNHTCASAMWKVSIELNIRLPTSYLKEFQPDLRSKAYIISKSGPEWHMLGKWLLESDTELQICCQPLLGVDYASSIGHNLRTYAQVSSSMTNLRSTNQDCVVIGDWALVSRVLPYILHSVGNSPVHITNCGSTSSDLLTMELSTASLVSGAYSNDIRMIPPHMSYSNLIGSRRLILSNHAEHLSSSYRSQGGVLIIVDFVKDLLNMLADTSYEADDVLEKQDIAEIAEIRTVTDGTRYLSSSSLYAIIRSRPKPVCFITSEIGSSCELQWHPDFSCLQYWSLYSEYPWPHLSSDTMSIIPWNRETFEDCKSLYSDFEGNQLARPGPTLGECELETMNAGIRNNRIRRSESSYIMDDCNVRSINLASPAFWGTHGGIRQTIYDL